MRIDLGGTTEPVELKIGSTVLRISIEGTGTATVEAATSASPESAPASGTTATHRTFTRKRVGGKRHISAEARERMAAAQRKRWNEYRRNHAK